MNTMKADQRIGIVKDLLIAVKDRLLHPAAYTDLIISFYTQAIQALTALDPSGSIVEVLCDPIRQYVRNRSDSAEVIVKQVISGFDNEEKAEEINPLEWNPDPKEAQLSSNRRQGKKSNLTDQLVEVFGNQGQFTETYQRLLSQRLMENLKDLDQKFDEMIPEELTRTLEHLRNRLGDESLCQAQVMVKDCKESAKYQFDSQIKVPIFIIILILNSLFQALIYSEQFWPDRIILPSEDKEKDLLLPKFINEQLDEIQASKLIDY